MQPLPRSAAVAALLAAGLMWPAQSSYAQQLPTKTYGKPTAEFTEPFTSVVGVRELSDGRVIVADPRDKVVQVVDFRTGRTTKLGREGSGPNEYQMPSRVFALPGDSTMIADPLNSRFLMLGPGGTLAGTWSPAADAAAGGGAADDRPQARPVPARAGGAPMVVNIGGGMGGPMAMMSTRTADAQGRLYMQGMPITIGPNGPQSADSIPLTRTARQAMTTDTLAWMQVPKGNASVSSGGGNTSIRIGGSTPFSPEDGWAVLPDGRVAVARSADYHVEVYPASGRGAPARGAPVRYTPVRVTEAEKQAWRDERQARPGIGIAVTAGGAGGMTRAPANIQQQEPTEWPAVKAPFQPNRVYALPHGDIWVGRYQAASDRSPRFDVFDDTGKHIGQVVFPPRTSIVGFGKGVVYTVRFDEDDLQYLQRYTLQ